MTIDHDYLLRVCEAATPGPWEVGREHIGAERGSVYCDNELGSRIAIVFGDEQKFTVFPREEERANALHIATFNPATVKTLLDELSQLRAQVEGLMVDGLIVDRLQEIVDLEGALLLHNGSGAGKGFIGFGLKHLNRTLRQAVQSDIDSAIAKEQP